MVMGEKRARGLGVLAVCSASLLVGAAASVALAREPAAAGPGKPRTHTCRGPAELSGFFKLAQRKIKARRASCAAARKVAIRFSKSCEKAYAGQGSCRVRASSRRWRCKSRIVGPLSKGAPSRETCRSKKARVTFVVAFVLPVEPSDFSPSATFATPYNDKQNCVDTSNPGRVLGSNGDAFEIHLFGGVSSSVGATLQSALSAHGVTSIFRAGLGSQPRIGPKRIWIFLTPKEFDPAGDFGIAAPTCANRSVDALVVRANQPEGDMASTAAHELFHAYSFYGIARAQVNVPWWEEASATWSEHRVGFPEVDMYDIALQYPNYPLDATAGTYKYAMSRFVQFLDDRGLIGAPGWPLQREVIAHYKAPGATKALADALVRRMRTPNPLGELVAEFWGDRLLAKPSHGVQLKPTGRNSKQFVIDPGTTVVSPPTKPLHTKLLDFKLAPNVARVEFEFAPDDNYFWGLVKPTDVRRFRGAESVSFCVGGGDEDDLAWPGHFPVTSTNGNLGGPEVKGEITIRAQSDPEQCTSPSRNRACKLLRQARVSDVLGDGIFPFASESGGDDVHHWLCFYNADTGGEVRLDLARFKEKAKRVRDRAKRIIDQLDLRKIDIGDLAGIGTISGGGEVTGVLVMAVGREIVFLMCGPGPKRQQLITLGKRISGQLR